MVVGNGLQLSMISYLVNMLLIRLISFTIYIKHIILTSSHVLYVFLADLVTFAEIVVMMKHKVLVSCSNHWVHKSALSAQLAFALAAMNFDVGNSNS